MHVNVGFFWLFRDFSLYFGRKWAETGARRTATTTIHSPAHLSPVVFPQRSPKVPRFAAPMKARLSPPAPYLASDDVGPLHRRGCLRADRTFSMELHDRLARDGSEPARDWSDRGLFQEIEGARA